MITSKEPVSSPVSVILNRAAVAGLVADVGHRSEEFGAGPGGMLCSRDTVVLSVSVTAVVGSASEGVTGRQDR
jgi:hypothetical protein